MDFKYKIMLLIIILISVMLLMETAYILIVRGMKVDCFGNNATSTLTNCYENTNSTSTTKVKEGIFKVQFSYPSEFTPTAKLCFENVNDLSEQYCFTSSGVIYSYETGLPEYVEDINNLKFNSYAGNSIEASLPAGSYYAYIIGYWKESNNNIPTTLISLNECTTATDTNFETECKDLQDAIKADMLSTTSRNSSEYMRNIQYGGDRIKYSIEEGKTLDLGTINLSPL